MPTLTIDNLPVTVPAGTNVLEAAKALGIVIPHFCYHEALGSVGACRLCAMRFEDGPIKGIQMACMVEAKDGMVVSTVDADAAEQRSHVIEWLMMNHPHDCPVCDEGGECQLQDMTIAGGHGIRRYRGSKRTWDNQDLGPFVVQEMNRCIQCYRCVRTYQDYCGGDDFGVMGTRNRLFFGRFRAGRLESPFSGNIVDACPTGVFTDKTFRYKSRYWDLQEAPSICPHCSLGCAVIPGARYRELQRVRSGINRQTNGFFICDRGRFGYGHANHPDRPRHPRVDGNRVDWREALLALGGRIAAQVKTHGPASVAFLGSPRASLEANWLLGRWAESIGSDRLLFDPHPQRDRTARTLAAGLGDLARSQEEIRHSDFILLVGADPLAEGPMLALAIRQAVRRGARVAILDPRPVTLPCAATHLPLTPEQLPLALTALVTGDFVAFSRQQQSLLAGIAARLDQAQRPVLLGAGDLLGAAGVDALLAATRHFDRPERRCGASLLLAAPNSYGAALLTGERPDADHLLDAILAGEVRTLVCLECDPFQDHPDPGRVEAALAQLELLVVLDAVPGQAGLRAAIFLPTMVAAESAGSYVNQEGRMLAFAAAYAPGIPISVTGGGDHPPRSFRTDTPGDEPRPAWQLLAVLAGLEPELEAVRAVLVAADPRFAGLAGLDPEGEGVRVSGPGQRPPAPPRPRPHCVPEGTLRLLPVESFVGSELLASLSAPLAPLRPEPEVLLHPDDAGRFGLVYGATARIATRFGQLQARVRLVTGMAPGLVIVPRLRGSSLACLVPGGPADECELASGEDA